MSVTDGSRGGVVAVVYSGSLRDRGRGTGSGCGSGSGSGRRRPRRCGSEKLGSNGKKSNGEKDIHRNLPQKEQRTVAVLRTRVKRVSRFLESKTQNPKPTTLNPKP